jgi:hypothetical protein
MAPPPTAEAAGPTSTTTMAPPTTPTTYVTPTTTPGPAPTGQVTAASTKTAPWWTPWFWLGWISGR